MEDHPTASDRGVMFTDNSFHGSIINIYIVENMNAPPTHDAPPTRDVPPTCDAPPTCDGQPTCDAPPTCDDPPIRTDISTPLTPPVGSKSPNSGLGSKLKPMTQATQHLVGAVEYRLEVAVSNVVTDILLESSPGKTVLRNMKRKKKWKEVVANAAEGLMHFAFMKWIQVFARNTQGNGNGNGNEDEDDQCYEAHVQTSIQFDEILPV